MKRIIQTVILFSLLGCSDIEHDSLLNINTDKPVECSNDVSLEDLNYVINASGLFNNRSRNTLNYSTQLVRSDNGTPLMYVVNFENDGGFIIISATKTHEPVLAYSQSGNYSVDNFSKPEGLLSWQKNVQHQILQSYENPEKTAKLMWNSISGSSVKALNTRAARSEQIPPEIAQMINDSISSWRSQGYRVQRASEYEPINEGERKSIENIETGIYWQLADCWLDCVFILDKESGSTYHKEDFLKSTWTQDNGYNSSFPTLSNGKKAYAGCATIAMGQIMRYFEYPPTFNWSEMSLYSPTVTTSNFLFELSQKLRAKYNLDGTSVSYNNVCKQFINYGYTATEGDADEYDIAREISCGRPVFFKGNSKDTGHAWVISGLRQSYFEYSHLIYYVSNPTLMTCDINNKDVSLYFMFYCNWGWGGSYNGYYSFKHFNPGSSSYNNDLKMIYNIHPN